MNLRTSVMLRISLAAMLCLVSVTAIVVLQAEQLGGTQLSNERIVGAPRRSALSPDPASCAAE